MAAPRAARFPLVGLDANANAFLLSMLMDAVGFSTARLRNHAEARARFLHEAKEAFVLPET
jgi:hypothetical protein